MNSRINNSIEGLDALRAAACLLVIIHHLGFFIDTAAFPVFFLNIIQAGKLGVSIFFVLSGFLLSLPFWANIKEQKGMPDLGHYFIRRFARIIPAYYLCVIILVLFNKLYGSRWEFVQLLALLSFTNSFIAAMFSPSFNLPLWSISIEVHCYLLLALFFYIIFKFKLSQRLPWIFFGTFVLLIIWQFIYLQIAPYLEEKIGDISIYKATSYAVMANSLMMFAHFLIGIGAGAIYLSKAGQQFIVKCKISNFIALSIIVIILISFFLGLNLPAINKMIYFWPTFPLLIAVFILFLPRAQKLYFISESTFIKFTAKISYGIYLWHYPVLFLLSDVLNIKDTSSFADLGRLLLSSLFLTYLLATLSYFLVEKYVIAAVKHYCSKKKISY